MNMFARQAIYWAYSDVDDDTPRRLGFDGWYDLYLETQKPEFDTLTCEKYQWLDVESGEYVRLHCCDQFAMSEQDTLAFLYDYAKHCYDVFIEE